MLLNILGALLLGLILFVLFRVLRKRWYSHWKPFVGLGWVLEYDEKTQQVTVKTFLLKSPVGRSGVKRGSIVLLRNGQPVPAFASKYEFIPWVKSLKPQLGETVTYTLLESWDKDEWVTREFTMQYEKLRGDIPVYAPLPTYEQRHADWVRLMPDFKAAYPTYRCPRTGVMYHRVRIIPVGEL